ncbi:MAG TPA: tRNA lysidine(34) synthetase TilS [Actinomycetota bacterium]|nr:tRNA lysidine(34) synthetase TilS [Actinomycetota bacterium]
MKPYWKPYGGPGFDLLEKCEKTIAAHRMLEHGQTVCVALSGGPDSTCLLDVLARLGEKLDLTLIIAHADHQLSDETAEVAARISSAAAQQGYEVHLARAPDLEGPNLHARARDFRYEFFEIVSEREGADRIATGHTLDDRVETTIARLIHGSGTSGLAGVPPVHGRRVRPLIDIRRSETRAYCTEVGLDFFDDPANSSRRFERSAIRQDIVTAIESRWGDGAIRAMGRSSELLRQDAEALSHLAETIYADLGVDAGTGVRFPREGLSALPRAFRRRLLELAVGRVRDRGGGIEAAVEAMEERSSRREVRFSVASGIEISIVGDDVLVSKLD